MSYIIQDGSGTGYKAAVDTSQRLQALATIQIENKFVSENDGQAYIFSTNGFITISTTDTETGIFYVKNTNQDKKLYISRIRTCAEQVHKVILYKNPTGGTVISDQTTGTKTNMNLGSANVAQADVYKGADGKTLSGGTHLAQHINGVGHSSESFNDAIILGTNDSIGITFELGTAGDCCVAVVGYYQ
jgi:hypothetical protein